MDYMLNATARKNIGKQTKQSRLAGFTPAVIYGKETQNQTIQMNAKEFNKIFHEAGTSSLISMTIDSAKPVKVLVKDFQIHPTKNEIVHADFYQVNMKEKIRTEIPLEFIGESPAVTEQDGKLVTNLDAIEVECLPDDLIANVEVDVSVLANFDDAIHVSDLKVPSTIEVLTDPELVIVLAQAPISEEQLEAELAEETNEAEAVAAVETSEKTEDEEDEGKAESEPADAVEKAPKDES